MRWIGAKDYCSRKVAEWRVVIMERKEDIDKVELAD